MKWKIKKKIKSALKAADETLYYISTFDEKTSRLSVVTLYSHSEKEAIKKFREKYPEKIIENISCL